MANIKLKEALPRIIDKINLISNQIHNNESVVTTKADRNGIGHLASGKMDKLTDEQLAVMNALPFTEADANKLAHVHTGAMFLGELIFDSSVSQDQIPLEIPKKLPITPKAGDIVEVVHDQGIPNTLQYFKCTYTVDNNGVGRWIVGWAGNVSFKTPQSVEYYTVQETNDKFLRRADMTMNDATLQALESKAINK